MDGWVYVFSNESMPGLVKVGFSMKDPEARTDELYQTGTPTPFRIEYSALVSDPRSVEAAAHRKLSSSRINPNREFFRCSPAEAIAVIESIVEPLFVKSKTTIEHEPDDREPTEEELQKYRDEHVKFHLEEYIEWEKQQLKLISEKKKALEDVNYLAHFWTWVFCCLLLWGTPAVSEAFPVNSYLGVAGVFFGAYLTRLYHINLIKTSKGYIELLMQEKAVRDKVQSVKEQLEKEALNEW